MAICQPLLQVVTDWPHIVQVWHVLQDKTNVTNLADDTAVTAIYK